MNGKTLKNKKASQKRTEKIIAILEKQYPSAKTALRHENAFELLVATILSAQCTDARVNMVTPGLFKKYPSVQHFASAVPQELEQDIRSTGDRKSVVEGKSVDLGGRRIIKKKT